MEISDLEESQYLTFKCGEELFALAILNIKEIKGYTPPTSIPMMSRFIKGVINLRGTVLPIIDLNLRFGRESTKITKRTCVIIVEVITEAETEKMNIGLLVDGVSEVVDIPPAEIEKTPEFGSKVRNDFIKSIGKLNGKFVIILDIQKVLSIDELSAIEDELLLKSNK
ncbi:MAG: purine-binding chemotaxis protein CheW [Leptospiraceae bacterium]|nr:purine-binding chemotaxis protein CheW [Leptospiraceae bacterium]